MATLMNYDDDLHTDAFRKTDIFPIRFPGLSRDKPTKERPTWGDVDVFVGSNDPSAISFDGEVRNIEISDSASTDLHDGWDTKYYHNANYTQWSIANNLFSSRGPYNYQDAKHLCRFIGKELIRKS